MSKITTYPSVTRFDANDVLIKDGTNGTKIIKASDAAVDMAGMISAIQHRNVYRGKNLGTEITTAQNNAIKNATFDDIFIGDYWTINGHRYVVADMNYWKGRYDNLTAGEGEDPILSEDANHLVIIPTFYGIAKKMNETNTTEGAYYGSAMNTTNLEELRGIIATDIGNRLMTHREIFSNAVTDGVPSAHVWCDSTVDLMNEPMVYGGFIHSPGNTGTVINHDHYTIDREQLAIFRLNPNAMGRIGFWLRDVVSASSFALVFSYGIANFNGASYAGALRPAFALKGV